MSSEKDPQATIVQLIQSAAQQPRPAAKKAARKTAARRTPARPAAAAAAAQAASNVISIDGSGNVVAMGAVHQTTHHHHTPARPKVVVKTGDGTIDAQQKAAVKQLVANWLDAHNAVKRAPLTWGAAWASFNRAMKVNGYAELHPDQLPAARAWLQRQVALINAMPSAAKKTGGKWRTARYGAIKAKCKNQLADEFAYVAYTLQHFGKTSLTTLDDQELERTYRYIIAK